MSGSNVNLRTRALFGGAVALDLPENVIDASDLRQIPDNQEVFLFPHSDTAVVLEILAMVEEGSAAGDLWEAAKYHFSSIAHDNASLQSAILTPPPTSPLPSSPSSFPTSSPLPTPTPVILSGTQKIHKFSHDPTGAPRPGHETDVADDVWIGVALWRVWLEGPEGKKKADVVLSVNVNLSSGDGNGPKEREIVEGWFKDAVWSMKILDYGLFGDSE
ncbi:hypothetical protein IAT38_005799 [Cryptococcus sp. DSM 104549]